MGVLRIGLSEHSEPQPPSALNCIFRYITCKRRRWPLCVCVCTRATQCTCIDLRCNGVSGESGEVKTPRVALGVLSFSQRCDCTNMDARL